MAIELSEKQIKDGLQIVRFGGIPYAANTPYVNTISPEDQHPYPGNYEKNLTCFLPVFSTPLFYFETLTGDF